MSHKDRRPKNTPLQDVVTRERKYNDYEYPKVSIVIPVFNNSEKIALTLDRILCQIYPDYEVIIVDGGSTDRTLEVVGNYRDERIQIYSVSGFKRYVMLNKGISQSTGDYVNCLFPGDFYIHPHALQEIMELALDCEKPDLVYCGTLLRDGRSDPKILYRPLTINLLKRGQQPTSLQSCWFRIDTLRELGKFNPNYKLRGGYELMCRFCTADELTHCATDHVLTDYDLRLVTRKMIFSHFIETLKTIFRYFGAAATVRWLFIQKDFYRWVKVWLRNIRVALVGR